MSEKGKSHLKTIESAMNLLPEEKKEYIIGYAEGVIAFVFEIQKKNHHSKAAKILFNNLHLCRLALFKLLLGSLFWR